jgi:Cys-tRNA(Pro) deacylase
MLMHGDKEVSLKELARSLGVKSVTQAEMKKALNATGYQFGGTSPFGTKKILDVYAEKSIFDLDGIFINGGKRGFIIEIKPDVLISLLNPQMVNVAI